MLRRVSSTLVFVPRRCMTSDSFWTHASPQASSPGKEAFELKKKPRTDDGAVFLSGRTCRGLLQWRATVRRLHVELHTGLGDEPDNASEEVEGGSGDLNFEVFVAMSTALPLLAERKGFSKIGEAQPGVGCGQPSGGPSRHSIALRVSSVVSLARASTVDTQV